MTTPLPPRLPQSDPLERDVPHYDARALLDGAPQARIALDDQVYTLRLTRNGKLILTK